MRFFTCLYFSNMAIILIEPFFTPGDKIQHPYLRSDYAAAAADVEDIDGDDDGDADADDDGQFGPDKSCPLH